MQQFQDAVAYFLPPELCKTTQIAGLSGGRLVLLAADTATATELRYRQTEIVARLNRKIEPTVTGLKVLLRPAPETKQEKPEGTRINSRNRRLLRQTADNLEDDELACVLRRLGRLEDQR